MTVLYVREGRDSARYPQTVTLEPARRSRVGLLAFGIAAVSLPLVMVTFPPSGELAFSGIYVWVGWLGLLVFGPATAYLVYRAIVRRPALRLTADGLTDESSMTSVGFVPWSEIVGVSTEEISKVTLVGVRVREPDEFVASLRWFRRIAARTNLRMFGVPVWINPSGLGGAAEVAALIDIYRRSWEREQQRPPVEPEKVWPFSDGGTTRRTEWHHT